VSVRLPVFGISRLRMGTDGPGVTSLVGTLGCPLRCRWCINPHAREADTPVKHYLPEELTEALRIDNLYFLATGGGVTFGGGEPLLHGEFIAEFARICPDGWKINAETSLSVPEKSLQAALPFIDRFIVDVKDLNPAIYERYTGRAIAPMLKNLRTLAEACPGKVHVRVPAIPEYNRTADHRRTVNRLKRMGFEEIEVFDYKKV